MFRKLGTLQAKPSADFIASLSLRRRSAEHPMAMFAVIVTTAFTFMALAPQSGPAFASIGASATLSESGMRSGKADRLPARASEADGACRGQAWGAETESCLVMMAKEAGTARNVRLITFG